jgi:hypothetical protein
MSDYGVGGDDWEALPWEWAGSRLTTTRNYWVTTVGPDGQPHSMPVWGVWHDPDLRFMFSCSPNARKARDLAGNPRLTFTTDDSVEAVSVQGVASPITDDDALDRWVARYVAKYSDEGGETMGEFVRAHACFEVVPTVAFAIIERADEFASRATRWRFRG